MDRLLSYGLIATVGVSSSTITSAIVGNPFAVVVPAIVGVAIIAAHHVRQKQADEAHPHDRELTDVFPQEDA